MSEVWYNFIKALLRFRVGFIKFNFSRADNENLRGDLKDIFSLLLLNLVCFNEKSGKYKHINEVNTDLCKY
jgi:hypothetical protein